MQRQCKSCDKIKTNDTKYGTKGKIHMENVTKVLSYAERHKTKGKHRNNA